jgi:excisionase family DNA binding protein
MPKTPPHDSEVKLRTACISTFSSPRFGAGYGRATSAALPNSHADIDRVPPPTRLCTSTTKPRKKVAPHEITSRVVHKQRSQNRKRPIWVSPREASFLTGIGLTRLYELLKDNTLKSVKIGRKRLVSFTSLELLGESQRGDS